jgi:hypothetical protein
MAPATQDARSAESAGVRQGRRQQAPAAVGGARGVAFTHGVASTQRRPLWRKQPWQPPNAQIAGRLRRKEQQHRLRGGGGGGGGESFLRVHWVAVPKALRARRVNRRRGGGTRWPPSEPRAPRGTQRRAALPGGSSLLALGGAAVRSSARGHLRSEP